MPGYRNKAIPADAKRVTRRGADGETQQGYIDAAGHFVPVPEKRERSRAPNPLVDHVPLVVLAAVLSGRDENMRATFTPGGIEAQEREEQKRMVKASRLPKAFKAYDWPADTSFRDKWDVLAEKLGIVKRADYDDLFVTVDLPTGWEIRASDHAMWSYLHDGKGRQRASIFYKGAFYDRRADWSLDRRYYTRMVYDTPNNDYAPNVDNITYGVWDADGNKALFKGEFYSRSDKDWAKQDAIEKEALEWLKAHFPDYANPFAYWD